MVMVAILSVLTHIALCPHLCVKLVQNISNNVGLSIKNAKESLGQILKTLSIATPEKNLSNFKI